MASSTERPPLCGRSKLSKVELSAPLWEIVGDNRDFLSAITHPDTEDLLVRRVALAICAENMRTRVQRVSSFTFAAATVGDFVPTIGTRSAA